MLLTEFAWMQVLDEHSAFDQSRIMEIVLAADNGHSLDCNRIYFYLSLMGYADKCGIKTNSQSGLNWFLLQFY